MSSFSLRFGLSLETFTFQALQLLNQRVENTTPGLSSPHSCCALDSVLSSSDDKLASLPSPAERPGRENSYRRVPGRG